MARIEKTHTDAPWRVLKVQPDGTFKQVGGKFPEAEKARRYARAESEAGVTLITAKMTYEVAWDAPRPEPKAKPEPKVEDVEDGGE